MYWVTDLLKEFGENVFHTKKIHTKIVNQENLTAHFETSRQKWLASKFLLSTYLSHFHSLKTLYFCENGVLMP